MPFLSKEFALLQDDILGAGDEHYFVSRLNPSGTIKANPGEGCVAVRVFNRHLRSMTIGNVGSFDVRRAQQLLPSVKADLEAYFFVPIISASEPEVFNREV